jgi:16S rRNA (cytosine967-C5)-methyltransferase
LKEAVPVAVEALSWLELRNLSEKLAVQKAVEQMQVVDARVINRAYEWVVEVTRRRNTLDHLLGQTMDDGLETLKLGVRNLLRLYVYILKYGGGSIAEALEISDTGRELLGRHALRRVEDAFTLLPYTELDTLSLSEVERVALETSHPGWFVEYMFNLIGDEAKEFLSVSSLPDYVRVNGLKDGWFVLKDCVFDKSEDLPGVYVVEECRQSLNLHEGYRGGLFTLQDKASILSVLTAEPRPGMTVLDVCAAPGGKTSHIADLMGNEGRIISLDYDERRLDTWRRETWRMGVEIAEPVLGDATKPSGIPEVEADVVFVDPPCTGTGTFARSPSGKWRITEKSVGRMSEIQASILENSARHVKGGGALVYCTCSVTLEENENVVEGFLGGNPEFRFSKSSVELGRPGFKGQDHAIRLFPHVDESNGFYIARLIRD